MRPSALAALVHLPNNRPAVSPTDDKKRPRSISDEENFELPLKQRRPPPPPQEQQKGQSIAAHRHVSTPASSFVDLSSAGSDDDFDRDPSSRSINGYKRGINLAGSVPTARPETSTEKVGRVG
jgi:hypothetical protein